MDSSARSWLWSSSSNTARRTRYWRLCSSTPGFLKSKGYYGSSLSSKNGQWPKGSKMAKMVYKRFFLHEYKGFRFLASMVRFTSMQLKTTINNTKSNHEKDIGNSLHHFGNCMASLMLFTRVSSNARKTHRQHSPYLPASISLAAQKQKEKGL